MNKTEIIKSIIQELENSVRTIQQSANMAHETATHEESQAKSKYDTFALEASYLANGQNKRLAELTQEIETCKNLILENFNNTKTIDLSALVTLEDEDQNSKILFLCPVAGGVKIHFQGNTISVVTPESPFGQNLIGKSVGDVFEMQMASQKREYEILKIE